MDNDSAHHAVIALRMYLTGDYVNLIDHSGDYLDKPHFLFWTSALSYHIFGVTSFAYKFPSFLFTILGVYSVFRLAKELYDHETGKLAALIAASSFCVILANNDVRMDAILMSCIAFASWQLVAFVHHRKSISLVGAALGLAIGFCTKGHIGLVTPVAGIFFYILYKKDWRLFYDWRWLIVIFLFALFISPVVYCYYLQFNLHPEKTIRELNKVNGVKFILWDHSFERITGRKQLGEAGKKDRFFFLHTFLWTFAPWCLTAFVALFFRLKNFLKRKPAPTGSGRQEWLSTGMFLLLALLINFSGFKLPHYLPILAPATAILSAHFFIEKKNDPAWQKAFFVLQLFASFSLLLLAVLINIWAFPVKSFWLLAIVILLLALVFYYFLSKNFLLIQKSIAVSVSAVALFFFLLNTNFYPQLLPYQGGKPLADITKGIANPKDVFFWKNTFSASYNFYSASLRQAYNDSIILPGKKYWLIYQQSQRLQVDSAGFVFGKTFAVPDYEITRLKKGFVDPVTRKEMLDSLVMAEVMEKK